MTLVATANCEVPDGTLITNQATVTSTTIDSEASNNVAGTTITAQNPPPEIVGLTAHRAGRQHKMIHILVGYDIADNCGGDLLAFGREQLNRRTWLRRITLSRLQVLDDHPVSS